MKIANSVKLLLLANLLSAGSQFALTAIRSADGTYLTNLQGKLQALRQGNYELRLQIYRQSNLAHIQQRAEVLKLSQAKIDFVTNNHEVALVVR